MVEIVADRPERAGVRRGPDEESVDGEDEPQVLAAVLGRRRDGWLGVDARVARSAAARAGVTVCRRVAAGLGRTVLVRAS